jgi:two-component system LytT family response regulator
VKVLIVDDEPVARRGLRAQLAALPGVECVGECANRADAVAEIVGRFPDVVLLDIQLGRSTAFDIIEDIGVDVMPFVVFVTAYDRHALKAFEVHALDYVLKPVDPVRLAESLERAATLLTLRRGASLADRLEGLLASREAAPEGNARDRTGDPARERFVVRDGERLRLIDVADVEWFESAGNYVRVHGARHSYLMRSTMDRVARRLQGGEFVRVRRSALVSIAAVATLERYGKASFVVHLRNGTKVISSRFYHSELRRLLHPAKC